MIFKMVAVGHLGYLKISFFFNCTTVQMAMCIIMQKFMVIDQTVAEI